MSRLLLLLLLVSATLSAQQQMPPANVVTAEVTSGQVNPTGKMVGLILFDRMSSVAGEIEGIVKDHYFDTGLVVNKGDALIQLDSGLLTKDIQATAAQLGATSADIEKQQNELKRLESLKKQSVASQSAYDNTFFELKALRSRYMALSHQKEKLELEVEKATVRAPFDAIVLEKKIEQGDWLGHGDTVARLGSTSGVRAIIPVDERLMRYQEVGQEYQVKLPALNREITGRFSGWVPFAELRSKAVYMKIALPYETGMVENMSAEVEVATAESSSMLLIPRAALLQNQQAPGVYTIKEGTALFAPVKILARSGEQIGVSSEVLSAGMPVVIDGNDRLKPGQPVNIINQ